MDKASIGRPSTRKDLQKNTECSRDCSVIRAPMTSRVSSSAQRLRKRERKKEVPGCI